VRLVVLRLAWREQEDLGVDPLEGVGERLLVVDVGDDLQTELLRPAVEILEVLLVVVLLDHDQAGVGACVPGRLGRSVDPEQDRQAGGVAQA
jgi:hypothetical protein